MALMPQRASVRVRRARPADLPALLVLEQRAFATDRMSPRQFRYHLRHPRNRLLVAEMQDELLGAALLMLRRGARSARLYSIAVAESARGRGIGRTLLRRCEREARAAGAERMVLEVRSDNEAALALYRTMGYQPFALRRQYYEDGADAIRLRKTLSTRTARTGRGRPERMPR